MRLKTVLRLAISAAVILVFASPATAQSVAGHDDARQLDACFCGSEEGTSDAVCFENALCSDLAPCTSTDQCGAGEQCLDSDNGCFQSVCVTECDPSTCSNPGTLSTGFEPCEIVMPTLGQWGLIALAALLLLGGATLLYRNGRASRTAFLVVSLAILTAGWAYSSIQSNPKICSQDENTVTLNWEP